MDNFTISFLYPWFLLLFIPALLITFIPYFRMNKKYRKTRNRITSIVLHLIVTTLAILTFAGIQFDYTVPNEKNEIIILVDVSDTQEVSASTRDGFVETLINDSKYDGFNVGVITFGFDQVYAVPLTNDVENAYEKYMEAPMPDTSATNIAAALEFAKTKFNNPQTGKIVLVTDAEETDEEAKLAIRSILYQGTKIDAAYIPTEFDEDDFSIAGIELPEYNVQPKQPCPIKIKLNSPTSVAGTLKLYDNGERSYDVPELVDFAQNETEFIIDHVFQDEGMHEIRVEFDVLTSDDAIEENNVYTTYLNIEKFNNILIIEREDESQELIRMLNEGSDESDPTYRITTLRVGSEDMPTTVAQLCAYDQVILNNISNADLQLCGADFDLYLDEYVSVHGGSMFTVGGNGEDGEANAYNRADMYGTDYQKMLPVQAINYAPPVGVIMIIDTSGSMAEADEQGNTYLAAAKEGARTCLNALRDKDYLGLMTLDSTYNVVLDPQPMSQRRVIEDAIDNLNDPSSGTAFAPSLSKAAEKLRQIKSMVSKLHIILVTDGKPGDNIGTYGPIIYDNYHNLGITMSIVAIGAAKGSEMEIAMQEAIDACEEPDPDKKGRVHLASNASALSNAIEDDLNAPIIQEVIDKDFNPTIVDQTSPLVYGLERGEGIDSNKLATTLKGLYGVRARASADVILAGEYEVPLYAQWKYGEGMVGSFMCDLQSTDWSKAFMDSNVGSEFIRRAINNLMPKESIRPNDIRLVLEEDNYTNRLSVYTTVNAGEYVTGTIEKWGEEEDISVSIGVTSTVENNEYLYVTTALNADNQYSRCYFVAKKPGVYKITIKKHDADGNVIATSTKYRSLAYSEEYVKPTKEQEQEALNNLVSWVDAANGNMIEDLDDPSIVFDGFVTDIAMSYDSRFLFMILAIVLFLLDIAVRKFKFKWIHEIIRDYKNNKNKNN